MAARKKTSRKKAPRKRPVAVARKQDRRCDRCGRSPRKHIRLPVAFGRALSLTATVLMCPTAVYKPGAISDE